MYTSQSTLPDNAHTIQIEVFQAHNLATGHGFILHNIYIVKHL